MNSSHVVALTAFALLLFFTSADCASAQGNNIRGKVRTAAGGNVASVTVTLESGNGAMISQTVTNNEGDFAFTGLDQTSYILVITAANYSPASERVDFYRAASLDNPGETRTVELTLSPNNGTRPPRVGLNFVQVVPDLARQAYERAARLLRENKQTEAIQAMREALKLFPDYFNVRLLLAREVLKAGDISQAVTQLDAARRINPNDDRVFYLFGIAMTRQRKYAVAARVFAEASRLSPLDAQYPLLRGTALIDQSAVVDRQSESAAADLNYI